MILHFNTPFFTKHGITFSSCIHIAYVLILFHAIEGFFFFFWSICEIYRVIKKNSKGWLARSMKFYRLTQIMCLLNPAKWEVCMLNTEYFINP